MLFRMAIMYYCDNISEYNCKPDSADTLFLTEFTKMHYPDESEAVLERHKNIYAKRHANLQERIVAIEEEVELLRLKQEAIDSGNDTVEFH